MPMPASQGQTAKVPANIWNSATKPARPGSPRLAKAARIVAAASRSEEHTSELQSLMRNSYAVFCLKKQKKSKTTTEVRPQHKRQSIPLTQHCNPTQQYKSTI